MIKTLLKRLLTGRSVVLMTVSGCSGTPPDSLGIHQNRLAICPAKPNCVSSDALDDKHRIAPFQVTGETKE